MKMLHYQKTLNYMARGSKALFSSHIFKAYSSFNMCQVCEVSIATRYGLDSPRIEADPSGRVV
jgi:hypothetical protein